jgi:hypothetical protein
MLLTEVELIWASLSFSVCLCMLSLTFLNKARSITSDSRTARGSTQFGGSNIIAWVIYWLCWPFLNFLV